MGQVLFTTFLGAVAGLLAWLAMEPFAYSDFFDPRWPVWTMYFSLVLGGSIGGWLGGILGYARGSRTHVLRGTFGGIFVGAVGGLCGMTLGAMISSAMFGRVLASGAFTATTIPARIVAFIPVGALVGLVMGIPARSWAAARNGFIGGAIGGGLAGGVFDLAGMLLGQLAILARGGNESGAPGRAILSIALGAGIGLCTSLVQRIARTAWVRQVFGRNEFKEWIVDSGETFIGRNESVHIPIFGDPGVAPVHAVIQRHQGNYYLADCGSGAPTYLNGQPIQQVPLFSGAMITVGQTQLEFVMRSGSAPQRAAEAFRGQFATPQGAVPAGYQGYVAAQPSTAPVSAVVPSAPTQVQPAADPIGGNTLVAISGPLTGQRFAVGQPIEVGRDCPAIPMGFDAQASRRHASLVPGPVGLVLTDLGSTNGTFVNDQRVQTTTLRPGDRVQMGGTVFRVE